MSFDYFLLVLDISQFLCLPFSALPFIDFLLNLHHLLIFAMTVVYSPTY